MNRESYRLMLKRKASATTSAVNTVGECTKAAKQQAQEVQARDTPRYALAAFDHPKDQPGKRFQFDCHSDDLQMTSHLVKMVVAQNWWHMVLLPQLQVIEVH